MVRGGTVHHIAQVNNVYIFPGVGLGAVAVGARRITDSMITAAAGAVAELAIAAPDRRLLPPIIAAEGCAHSVAVAVAVQAVVDGVAPLPSYEPAATPAGPSSDPSATPAGPSATPAGPLDPSDLSRITAAVDRHRWRPRYT